MRLGAAISHDELLRYDAESSGLLGGSGGLALDLQKSILESSAEIAELASRLEQEAAHDDSGNPHQVEINAIRGALSAGWQWWSGTNELLGYWAGERPICGHPE